MQGAKASASDSSRATVCNNFISHDTALADVLGDCIVIMEFGEIASQGDNGLIFCNARYE